MPRSVVGDPARVRQILVNLIGNATKFTEKGQIALRITTTAHQPKDANIRIDVSDTGIGIPLEKSPPRDLSSWTKAVVNGPNWKRS